MSAGRRNTPILIQEPIESTNDYGEKEIAWVKHSEPWAFISKEKGREFFAAQQINNLNPMEITVNYNRTLSDKFRVVYEDRIYEIRSCSGNRKKNEHQIMCSEIT